MRCFQTAWWLHSGMSLLFQGTCPELSPPPPLIFARFSLTRLRSCAPGSLWGSTKSYRWRSSGAVESKINRKSGHDSCVAAGGVFSRRVCPFTRGGHQQAGAAPPEVPGAFREAEACREPPAPAPCPLRSLEDVPEGREAPGSGEPALHGVRVWSPRQHRQTRPRPR